MKTKKFTCLLFFTIFLFILMRCKETKVEIDVPWKGIHLLNYNTDDDLNELATILPQLSKMGINVLVLEIDYHYEFATHPELRQGEKQISKAGAKQFAKICRKNGIRLIPQFQCLGHQSWAKNTFTLLTVYPELDLTPNAYPDNEGIYCREWDPYNPRVNTIVFALMREIIDAFDADAMHVGMDEVFLINNEYAISTKDKDPAQVFAHVVNDMHAFLVKECGVEMLMWGDRFIDANKINYGEWEASMNGTAPAIDSVPKDIIICDWHYEPREAYESVPMFLEKGFRVLPSSWKNAEASQAFINDSFSFNNKNMLGHLFTTWNKMDPTKLVEYEPMIKGVELIKKLD